MRKRKINAVLVLVALMLSIVTPGAMAKSYSSNVNLQINQDGSVQVSMKFKDLQEANWAMKNILKMNAENVIMGYEDGSFRPNKPVTHAEAVVLTMRAAGLQSEIDSKVAGAVYLPFKDARSIPGWAEKAVAVAAEKGFLQVGPSGNFQPNKEANREWVVKLIAKALNLQPVNIQLPFTDAEKISADTAGYVAAVVYKQLISGFPDGSFRPNQPITRAELAVMLGISTNEVRVPGKMKFKVEGTIDSISMQAATVTGQMYGGVADQVYGDSQAQGSITLKVNKDDDEDEDEDEGRMNQSSVTYPVAANALIYLDEQTARLGDLSIGAKAEAIIKNGMVTYLEVEPVVVRGVVQAVYNNTITVINNNWERGKRHKALMADTSTYNLAGDVAVTLNGNTARVSDLQAGDIVRMTMNADKVTSIKASRFNFRTNEKNGNNNNGNHNNGDRNNGNYKNDNHNNGNNQDRESIKNEKAKEREKRKQERKQENDEG